MRSLVAAVLLVLAPTACVTDPLAETESSYVKEMRALDGRCRAAVKKRMKGGVTRGMYYFARVPREPLRTHVVLLGKGGGTTLYCDNETGKISENGKLSAKQAAAFSKQFDRRKKQTLAGQKAELRLGESSTSALVELDGAKASDYWLPKHMEKEFNDLFYDAFK